MTKFTDRLENDLSHIADQASPSPTAWDAIQKRMTEPEPNSARDIIMLTDEREQVTTPTDRRWLAVAAAIAIGVLAIGAFALGRGDDEDLLITDDPPVEDSVSIDGDDEEPVPVTTERSTGEASPLVVGLPVEDLMQTDQLGMDMTFEVPEPMSTQYVEAGAFAVISRDEAGDFQPMFGASRVGGWYDQDQAINNSYLGEGGIEANDVEAWIEANRLIGQRLPDATVSGRQASVYDVRIDETVEGSLYDDCPRCILFHTVSSEFFDPDTTQNGTKILGAGTRLRIWHVEVDGFDPILIWAGSYEADDESYLDEFEARVLPTIQIGPDAGPSSSPEPAATEIVVGQAMSPGLYETDLLGETIAFDIVRESSILFARRGEFAVVSDGQEREYFIAARISGWYTRSEAADDAYEGEGSIDANNPEAWLADLGFNAEMRAGFVEVSDRFATVYDITVDPDVADTFAEACTACELFYSTPTDLTDPPNPGDAGITIDARITMRMFFFEGPDGADPFGFFAVVTGDDLRYLDEFEATILPTIQFEPTS